MFPGDDGYGMPFSKGEQVRKSNTFSPDYPLVIGKDRGNGFDLIGTKRAVQRSWESYYILINVAFNTFRTYLATKSGIQFCSFLQHPISNRNFSYRKHIHPDEQ
ncbi:MAG: hypothetical protein A4E35_00164 [Methanoregula sp. PtaU1.Bin051]|nr:MAG: hypothetical protein A4E35_00164 [Methanoregula sp. PtaU1.Bin051]